MDYSTQGKASLDINEITKSWEKRKQQWRNTKQSILHRLKRALQKLYFIKWITFAVKYRFALLNKKTHENAIKVMDNNANRKNINAEIQNTL